MNDYEKRWLADRCPDHDEWRREQLGLKADEPFPEPPSEEARHAAIAARNAAVAAQVKATVATRFPYLLDPADCAPRAADPKTELDREVADAAEAFLNRGTV